MPSPHIIASAAFSNAGTAQSQSYYHHLNHPDQDQDQDHRYLPQQAQQTHRPHPLWTQQQQSYQKQHRLSRSFPSSTNQLPAPRYHGIRSDRPQAPVSSSLGNRLDVGTGTGTGIGTSIYFSRKTPSPLPRTSSLLPSSQPSAQFPLTGFDAVTYESTIPHPSIDSQAPSYVIPFTAHSRSSSIALSAEEDRNLNRWSASTTSSRNSAQNHHANSIHARRSSVDPSALFPPSSTLTKSQSLQRLLGGRRRSSSSETSWGAYSSGSRSRTYSPAGPARADRLSTVFIPHQLDFPFGTEPPPGGYATRPPPGASRAYKGPSGVEKNQVWDAFSGQGRRGSAEPGLQQLPYTGMSSDHNGEASQVRGHSRNRSQTAAKGSTDTTGSSRERERGNRPPSQKAMLSRALQKANTAVQLDNAQNFEGARHAYAEACDLLHQVLARTSTDEDRRKLEAIRRTYTSRIEELDQMAPIQLESEGKALPARPESLGLRLNPSLQFDDDNDLEEPAGLETATLNRISRDGSRSSPNYGGPGLPISRMQTLGELSKNSARVSEHYTLQSSFSRSSLRDRASDEQLIFQMPAEDTSLPRPLSPQRPWSPKLDDRSNPDGPVKSDFLLTARRTNQSPRHIRNSSRESNSWLDPIDESGGSTASSIHSRPSSAIVRRKHIRSPSGTTEAEFDAALDAAVEAAYDDGYEPMGFSDPEGHGLDDPVLAKALRKVELAKERVRRNEREAFEQANGIQQREQSLAEQEFDEDVIHEDFYDDGSSDEEERILEEMTHDYSVDQFAFNLASHQAAVRNSGSSDLAESAWKATVASTNTVAADVSTSPTDPSGTTHFPGAGSPKAPPPLQALPELPVKKPFSATTSSPGPGQSVRSRRMSGQNPKQLKIETSKLSQFGDPGRRYSVAQAPSGTHGIEFDTLDMTGPADMNDTVGRPYSPPEGISPTQPVPPTPPFGHTRSRDSEDFTGSHTGSPSFRPPLRKNFSSSSLRSMKNRNMSLSNLDDASDMSPGTPLSTGFGINSRYPAMPTLPTPLAAAFRDKFTSSSAGGLYLFDDSLHSPQSPGSPNPLQGDAPVPLEPCPTDYLLRPFWLMRCLYQTLAHPRGGYLSNKLFVPRDVWKVKGVKIRNVEDKVATCDYLTAALLKLARVDTCDADAVLEEMQYLEGILEQVQANLTRKLGTDVGVQNSSMLFRDASNSAEIEAAISVPRSGSVSGKSSSFSWRRLRSKNSAAGLNNSFNAKGNGLESGKESPGPETLPMTDHPTSRPSKRDPGNAQFTGPNAHYMGSLARLFDAAQTIDQIARQVEDPGLRHADKTQVGLELCTRHAAEFFGFFICRFVLSDLSLLLDKFIKRGSEWVLA
ncbi:MIT domain-containing protein [Colletotrichum navitas]|uniref:MIT domain-containing protein n=1 Tax=Colletotrichum navitas TaxID=681940 RepID=A0AAD8V192_9PEZI|nr:MIT domain-containing protein [Colletotrichum navitas]KAK1579502.1 MIT domain-containing protein [Colletotrichum navitas]